MVKRSYKQFCPTARALNVVGDRWTLLIVRNLLIAPRRYTDLRAGLKGMASNLLAQRLTEMEDAGLITKQELDDPTPRTVYVLTDRGRELEAVLIELARFGFPYLDMPTEEEPMEAERVPLGLVAMMHATELPDHELRIRFALDEGDHTVTLGPAGPPGARRTLTERATALPTADDPGPVDVTVTGSMVGLLWIRQGVISGADAQAQGLLELAGDPAAIAALKLIYRFDPVPT